MRLIYKQIKDAWCKMKDEEASSPDSGRKSSGVPRGQRQQERRQPHLQQQQQQVSLHRIFFLRTELKHISRAGETATGEYKGSNILN